MGVGRKTKTLHLKEKGATSWTTNGSAPARNLRKSDLGAVIFGCKNNTINECLTKLLFGLPAPHLSYVKNIRPGLPLLLFNYSDRKLHGIYEAISQGQMNIDPYGWCADSSDYTPYGAQVRIKVRMQCSPLSEDEFKPIIAENYYEPKLFWFELDQTQTHKLISLFASRISVSRPLNIAKSFPNSKNAIKKRSDSGVQISSTVSAPLDYTIVEWEGSWDGHYGVNEKNALQLNPGRSYAAIVSGTDSSLTENKLIPYSERKWSSLFQSSTSNGTTKKDEGASSSDVALQNGENVFSEADNSGWAIEENDVKNKAFGWASDIPWQIGDTENSEFNNSGWAENDVENQSFQANDPVWESLSNVQLQNGENEFSEANNSGWVNGKNNVEKEVFETNNSEWASGNYNGEWEVQAIDTSCEAPIYSDKGNNNNNLPCSDGSQADQGWSSASEAFPQPEYFAEICEELSHTEANTECSYSSAAIEMDYTDNNEEENGDPSLMAVEVHCGDNKYSSEIMAITEMASPDVQALVFKLMEEIEALKVSHKFLQGELVESRAKIQLLNTLYHTLKSRLLPSTEDVEESMTESFNETHPVESKAEIRMLNTQYHKLESRLLPLTKDVEEAMTESFNETRPVIIDPILIIGGYDGYSWLPDLCSYLPFEDVMRPLAPMSVIRKYSAAVNMNGELYVIGGADGDLWHDTVESYNPVTDQWSSCPSLNQKKGSLAGASLSEKIFAIGGGDGNECFSNVEMLDFNLGRWIPARSMLHKRFAPAAAELNGAVYVVGGYDGINYLSSAERFDPREHSWEKLENMGTKRGCHSLTVLNEKLYAMGGFDGASLVSSTEIFDSRKGLWMMGDPMSCPRGYCGTVVLGEKIHIIGGITTNDEILETVEVYEEGRGWEITDLKGIGKRCYFSAMVL